MSSVISLPLRPEFFGESERELLSVPGFSISTFRYSTGIPGLRITNEVGEIEFLPFKGQQIWRADFYGRNLTMESMFPEPRQTSKYLDTYGAFLIHCGVTGLGAPASEDEHELHGELPNANYQIANLEVGSDERGTFIALTGRYQHSVAFTHNYIAQPKITLRQSSSRIDVDFTLTNLKQSTMDVMYLSHINFVPVANGQIIDTVPDNKESLRVIHVFDHLYRDGSEYKAMIDHFKQNPESHRIFSPEGVIDPEVVFALNPKTDHAGWATSLQIHPDGSSDFVRHRPDQFRNSLRWICRSGDQKALGLLLPSTSEPSGYIAEREKGNYLQLSTGESMTFSYQCGALNPLETEVLIREINSIKESK